MPVDDNSTTMESFPTIDWLESTDHKHPQPLEQMGWSVESLVPVESVVGLAATGHTVCQAHKGESAHIPHLPQRTILLRL